MEILQLNLKHFGRFTDYRLDLHAGINIISGGNETGKSTLHAFIRAMLYGISRNRSRSLDEYQLREPWENPAYFAGSMKILYEEKIYRIDRNFHRGEESLAVVCETDGTQAEDPQQALNAFMGGLSEADFDNTVFIRQAQPQTAGQLSGRLRDYLINQELAAKDTVDVGAAQDHLKKKKKAVEAEKAAAYAAIEGEIREKTQESDYIQRDLERLLDKRAKEQAGQDPHSPFERVSDPTDSDQAAENGRILSGGERDTAVPDSVQINVGARAAGTAGPDSSRAPAMGTAGPDSGRAPAMGTAVPDSAGGAEAGQTAGAMYEASEEEEKEDTSGVLLPVLALLAFAASGGLCACAVLSSGMKLRVLTGAGAVLFGIAAIVLLWRILHPVSRTERMLKRMKREAFLNRHLGFREDPEDPEDRAEQLRRERKAREAVEQAREEEEREERLREERRRAQLEQAIKAEEEAERKRRGQDVARIARTQVLGREISQRREQMDALREELEALYARKAALKSYDAQIRAIQLAQGRISELAGNLYHETGAGFAEKGSALLAALTDGQYTRISLDEKMLVRLNTPDRLLTLEQVSFGTMNQVYFAMRITAADLLSGGARIPIILDEPFAMYDEERLEKALRYLSGLPRQVILFSCQTRELDLLSSIRRR